ncbi:MAG: class I SAM-dependent methyltransferase [Thermodesulfovibrionales bacterium]
MKLNLFEQLITNNPVRASIQRHIEGPMLWKMGSQRAYPLSLEIGCGSGIGAQVIVEQFGAEKVIATDIDPEQIERARNNLMPAFKDRIEFKLEDAMALAEPDETFDAVFSFGVLHHMEDWRKAVKEISRVLKGGGEFFFEEPFRPFLKNILVRTLTAHPEGGEFDYEEFKIELAKNNIDMVNMKRIKDIAIFCVGRKL